MKLGDLIVFFPGAIMGTIAKTIKTHIPEETKKYIDENHLYHCVPRKDTINKILESGYIKPATGIFKNINSYGKSACCMFAGMPSMDSFIKNCSVNPYLNPDKIIYVVELDVNKEELNNYKIRPFSDETILYEGYCSFTNEKVKGVELVADLIRDENGNPIMDEKTGKPQGIKLRKRTQQEIEKNPNKYIPDRDYLEYVNEKKKQFGFVQGENAISKGYNKASNILAGGKFEYNEVTRSTKKNFITIIKESLARMKRTKRIDENPDVKINKALRGKSFLGRKNPYGDKKFAIAVSEFQKQGLTQLDLQKILPDFVNSKDGVFLRDKYNQIDKNPINQTGIHGIKHNDRVAILSLIIGQEEGILKEESTREREILTYVAYYHDIGRVLPIGPHAKRSARLCSNLKFTTLEGKPFSSEDKRITQLLIEGHEGKDEKVEKLIKKYNIADQDVEMVKNLTNILKDADALDRSRLAIDTPIATITDLDPKYLRLNTSKRLIEASYGLEYLTKKVNTNDLLNYKNENINKHYYNRRQNIENLKVDKETMELNRKRNLRNQEKNVSNNKQEKGEEKE